MDEKQYYTESQATKPATLNCPYCKSAETYDLHWLVRVRSRRCRCARRAHSLGALCACNRRPEGA